MDPLELGKRMPPVAPQRVASTNVAAAGRWNDARRPVAAGGEMEAAQAADPPPDQQAAAGGGSPKRTRNGSLIDVYTYFKDTH